jgi:hypothetical protein
VFARKYGLIVLVRYLAGLDHDSVGWLFRDIALLFDRNLNPNRIADKDRFDESKPVVAIRNSMRIDDTRGESDAHAEDQRSMGDAPSKWLGTAPFLVHVVWIKVSGLASMKHDIGLGDGTPSCVSLRSHDVFFEILSIHHFFLLRRHNQPSWIPLAALTWALMAFSYFELDFAGKTCATSLALPKSLWQSTQRYRARDAETYLIRYYLCSGMAIILLALGVLAMAQWS